jgi:hypothetical protein
MMISYLHSNQILTFFSWLYFYYTIPASTYAQVKRLNLTDFLKAIDPISAV